MAKDLTVKLAEILGNPIDTEPTAVYLLAHVRKLLERDASGGKLVSLRMYCHWALHVDLDKPKTTGDFLDRVDRWVTHTVAYLTPRGCWSFLEEFRLLEDFIFLDTFRQQLLQFLAAYKLPTTLCDDEALWSRFVTAYSGVIEGGSLSISDKKNSGKTNPLSAVQRVTFEKGAALTPDHHVPFVIQWTIYLKDLRILKTSVETAPGASGRAQAHGLEIISNGFVAPSPPPQPAQ